MSMNAEQRFQTPHQVLEVDLAVGFMPHLEAGFYQQKLFDQNFVCLAALDHPRIHSPLTREAFVNERFLVGDEVQRRRVRPFVKIIVFHKRNDAVSHWVMGAAARARVCGWF